MQILVTVVSSNKLVLKTFIKRESAILNGDFMPRELRGKVSFVARVFDPGDKSLSLEKFLLDCSNGMDAVAVLLDACCTQEAERLCHALFIGVVNFQGYMPNVQNVLSGHLAKLLRNLGSLLLLLNDSTAFQAAILPLRNFQAGELNDLSHICNARTLEGDFPNELCEPLKRLMTRRGPKRRSSYPTRYFRDDGNRYFQYGHERHSRFDTGGNHRISCHINGLFRFGKRLEEARHFNITQGDSDEAQISATFLDCHDEPHEIARRTHVNMFSNDFHK